MGVDGEPEKEIVMQMMKVNTVNISIGSNIKILFPGHSGYIYLIFLGICVHVWVYVYHINAGACRSQKRTLKLLELELQATVCHLMEVLKTEPGPL